MPERKEIKKFTFTVEGETEKWYLEWLKNSINSCETAKYKVAIVSKVQQNPCKFVKSQTVFSTPSITHFCDLESNDTEHKKKFVDIMDQIDKANKLGKKIRYNLGYSNFTFELWITLHKIDCNGPLSHRLKYLSFINRAFDEHFEDLDRFKREENFKRCMSKLSLKDVKEAISRSRQIMDKNATDPGKHLTKYRKFEYYQDNPALTVWVFVARILRECGV